MWKGIIAAIGPHSEPNLSSSVVEIIEFNPGTVKNGTESASASVTVFWDLLLGPSEIKKYKNRVKRWYGENFIFWLKFASGCFFLHCWRMIVNF